MFRVVARVLLGCFDWLPMCSKWLIGHYYGVLKGCQGVARWFLGFPKWLSGCW